MKTLQKYLLTEFLKLFFPISLFFILIFASSEFFWRLPDFLYFKPHWITIIYYLSTLIPLWFVQTLPIVVMLSSLLTITHFMYTKELISIQTLGINLKKFFISWLIIGILISIVGFFIHDKLATKGFLISQKIFNEKIKCQPSQIESLKNLFYYDNKKNTFVFIKEYNNNSLDAKDIIIEQYDEQNNLNKQIISPYAKRYKNILILHNCIIREFKENKFLKEKSVLTYEYHLPIDIEEFQYDYSLIQLDFLTVKKLKNILKTLKLSGQNTARILSEISFRYSIAFLNFILILLSVSLGQNISSQYGKFTSFIYTILALIVYWILLSFLRTLGELNIINPIISVWIPNILFFVIGLFLYIR
ncbi:MAG: LptF/LptG family permease [Endomicrobiia bacterium]